MTNEAEAGLVKVDHEELERFMKDVFVKLGLPPDDAAISARVLITSDLRGITTHGVGRIKYYYDRIARGQHETTTKIDVVKDTPTTAVLDGNHGTGHVIAHKAMSMAIEKAKKVGLGCVAVRNSTHFGIAGYYPLMAIKEGLIGMACTNARPSIPPTFGVEPMMGTNPLVFGVPTDEEFPFLIDCATSIIQRGKVEEKDRANEPLHEGLVIDDQGEYLTQPKAILEAMVQGKAALLPVGGALEETGSHKGYGYAATVELLSAVLTGGAFLWGISGLEHGKEGGKHVRFRVGHFFMAINPEFFMGLETCKKTAGNILRELRAARKAPGHDHIYTAGEKEYLAEQRVREEGVPIPVGLQADIKFLVKELDLTGYSFPFL